MSKLTIHDWDGTKREVTFFGYNRNHTACLVRDEKNDRRAIGLCLPERFRIQFRGNPIAPTNEPPVAINRRAVHLPACFASSQEMADFVQKMMPAVQQQELEPSADHWKVFSAISNRYCLLEPGDDRMLLAMWHAEQTGPVTLEELRQGRGGVREKFLEREWADRFGVNLDEIPRAARVFRTWLAKHAFHPGYPTRDLATVLNPWQWEVLEASIRYEILFDDNSRRGWLDKIHDRPITDPQENEDFDRWDGKVEATLRERKEVEAKAEKNIAEGGAVAEKLTAAAGEVRKAAEIGDLYSNPSMADAKNAAVKAGVPKEFVAYCFTEMHLRKFPSARQAYKAVCELPLFRALRDPETPSQTTVWRNWWRPLRDELEKRGLLDPIGKGKSAKRAASYDVSRHPEKQPGDVTLEDAEGEQLRAGKTDRDSRTNELPDEPESFDPPDRPGLH